MRRNAVYIIFALVMLLRGFADAIMMRAQQALASGGAVLVMLSMFVGDFAATGWVAYPPLSELGYSPTAGVDYYIWALQISGLGTLLSGINLS
jgi:heme/copper-type cytochrome/quinol oxidase subunit 1